MVGPTRNYPSGPITPTKKAGASHDAPALAFVSPSSPNQLHPDVAPHVSHLAHAPLRTSVNWPHSGHGSPSYPLSRARRIFSSDDSRGDATTAGPFAGAAPVPSLCPLPLPFPLSGFRCPLRGVENGSGLSAFSDR